MLGPASFCTSGRLGIPEGTGVSRDGWRPHIESALALDLACPSVGPVVAPNVKQSGIWRWLRDGEEFAAIRYSLETADASGTLELGYVITDRTTADRRVVCCRINLSTTRLHFGGVRWWMHCPYTGRRARKLYKFGPIDQFCHRTAIRPLPTYASQRVSGCERVMAQRWALRRKMGDDISDLFEEPWKPKWMRSKTFERFRDRDADLWMKEENYLARFLSRLRPRTRR